MATVQAPTSSELIPLSAPDLSGNEAAYLQECVRSGWVSSAGPFVEKFEGALAELTGAAHAVAIMNGTAGLHLALRALRIREGDEVIVPTLTFIAPVNAVRYCGAQPVFIDADPATFQMDVDKLEQALIRRKGRVRAIMAVHLLGFACEMDRIMALARAHGVAVIEDACEAIGVRYRNQSCGTWGAIGVFSFNGNKTVTSGGGGVVVTEHPALADRVRYLSTQAKDDPRAYIHREIGYNYRLTNLQAAVGLAQLERLEPFIERKRAIAAGYDEAFRGLDGVLPMPAPDESDGSRWTYWLYTMLLPEGTRVGQRDAVIDELASRGIEARALWYPVHALLPYAGCDAEQMEHAMALHRRGVSLPSSVGLTENKQARVVEAVKAVVAR